MTLPSGMVTAVYQDTGIPSYHGNPLIEALPPIPDRKQLIAGLSETTELRPSEIYLDGQRRVHIISQLLDGVRGSKHCYWRPLGPLTERL